MQTVANKDFNIQITQEHGLIINDKTIKTKNINTALKQVPKTTYLRSNCETKWRHEMNKYIDFNPIWSCLKNIQCSRKIVQFQWKCLHNIITTELTLRNMNKSNGICRLCNNSLETQRHLFLECTNAARLWSDIKTIMNDEIELTALTEENIMLLTEENNIIAADICNTILTVKWVIWKERCVIRYQDNVNIGYTHYKTLLKYELQELKHMKQHNTAIHNKIINAL